MLLLLFRRASRLRRPIGVDPVSSQTGFDYTRHPRVDAEGTEPACEPPGGITVIANASRVLLTTGSVGRNN